MSLSALGRSLLASATLFALAACEVPPAGNAPGAVAGGDPIARGRYLVSIGGCIDCHTPGYFLGQPDPNRLLAGSDVGFFIPNLGTFYGPNLTPDPNTGLGTWTEEQIVAAIRTGVRPDGRVLAPIMPWMMLANLTDEDAMAMAAYLKSLPPVTNGQEIAPVGPNQAPPGLYMAILPPGTLPPVPPAPPGEQPAPLPAPDIAPGLEAPVIPPPQ